MSHAIEGRSPKNSSLPDRRNNVHVHQTTTWHFHREENICSNYANVHVPGPLKNLKKTSM